MSATPALAVESDNPMLQRGVRLIQRMEETAGLRVLMRALRWPQNTDRDRALIHLYRGIAYGNMLHEQGARRSFRQALRFDASVRVPGSVSPKIRAIFDAVLAALRRARVEGRRRAAAAAAAAAPRDRTSETDDGADDRGRDVSRQRSGIYWPGWITGGVAVAALATAIGLGVASRADQSAADDPNLPFSRAKTLVDHAESKALGANVMFGVAGAAAVMSAVLFVLHYRSKPERVARRRRQKSAAVVPLAGGGAIAVGGFSW
ncbi:MAG: hypothetical protein KC503_28860 [Myxococcales bacterium]|nr:hypothetical protein [Myxococcales bacterium]